MVRRRGVLDAHADQRAALGIHGGLPELLGVHLAQALVALHVDAAFAELLHEPVLLVVRVAVLLDVALLHAVERRLGHVDVAALDDLAEVAEEEGEHQGQDVRAVHVGVRHDDDAVVTELLDVEDARAHAGAEGRDDRTHLVVAQSLVEPGLLHVEDLALQRQDGLEAPVAALFRRAAGGVALHQVDLAVRGIGVGTVGQLAGQGGRVQRRLAARQVAGAARRLAGLGGAHALVDHLLGDGGVLRQVLAKGRVDKLFNLPLDLGVAELGLGLSLELGLGDLHRDHRGQPLSHVVAAEALEILLEEVLLLGVGVDGARQAGAEAGQMSAAFVGRDVVREGEQVLGVAVVVVHGDLDLDAVLLALEIDRIAAEGVLVLVDPLHVFDDAALVAEGLSALLVRALVPDGYGQAPVQEGQLAHARLEGVEQVGGVGKDQRVRPEGDRGAVVLVRVVADGRHGAGGLSPLVFLHVDLAVAAHLGPQRHREGVDAAHAHAVQSAGHLVAALVELAAGVQAGHDDLQRRLAFGGVHVHGDAAPVVDHADAAVGQDGHGDLFAEAGEGLVD